MVMWFVTKNIIEYISNEDIPKDKRIKVIKNNRTKVVEEVKKEFSLESRTLSEYLGELKDGIEFLDTEIRLDMIPKSIAKFI